MLQELEKKRDSVIEVSVLWIRRLSGICERSYFSREKDVQVTLQLTEGNVEGIEIEAVTIDYFYKHFNIITF